MRCFFALSPPKQVRAEIDSLAASLYRQASGIAPGITHGNSSGNSSGQKHGRRYGRRIPAENYHVTLHFLGEVSEDQLDCYRSAADGLHAPSFSLRLDTTGFFRRAGIGWIGPEICPDNLLQLHEQLADQLSACGYRHEQRSYLPHVSLFRRCQKPLKPAQPFLIDWQVKDFSLFESVPTRDGVIYRELCNYPL